MSTNPYSVPSPSSNPEERFRFDGWERLKAFGITERIGEQVMREIIDELKKDDIEVIELSITGKTHYRMKLRRGADTALVFTPGTPSDGFRGQKNFIAEARKRLQESTT